MQIDLSTLYSLLIGTLLLAAAMTFWERQERPGRARELRIWAASYVVFALGCAASLTRSHFPGTSGMAVTNLLMMLGYLLVWHGAARLDGSSRLPHTVAALALVALLWWAAGAAYAGAIWNYVSGLIIAAACGLTAWTLLKSRMAQGLRSRRLAIAVSATHAGFNLIRAFVAPLLVSAYGDGVVPLFGKLTMYEGVLYSVALPMAFLALVREEAQRNLLAASRTDYLTGLDNRQGFFERGGLALAERAAGEPTALLAFDLDHFKAINDQHGHAAGDAVLKLFADVARETAGADAILARLGGEEFAALLPGHNLTTARLTAEAVAQRFSAMAARSDDLAIQATVSVGLVQLRAGAGGLSDLLSAADRALYRAKALGRNRVEIAEPLAVAAAA